MWKFVIALQAMHLVYHQITTIFDFYPFNNVRAYSGKLQYTELAINAVFMGFPLVATILGNRTMMWIGVVCLGMTLCGEYFNWWHSYIVKPMPWWKKVWEKKYRETIIVLPTIKDHPIPNLEHLILHTLTLMTFVVTLIYMIITRN